MPMLACFFLSCTVSSVVSIFENTPISHVGCSKSVLQPQVSASTVLLSTQKTLKLWRVRKSWLAKEKNIIISSMFNGDMEISTNSHQNLLIHSRKHLPTAPRHHPNCNVPSFQTPQADHFWHAGEPTPRLSSSFTGCNPGVGPSGSNPKWSNLGSKQLVVSGWTMFILNIR